jgi:hypothetical protein
MNNQAETSRINGSKSQGPITAEGKAISAQNSLKHGATASRVVLKHESQAEFDELKDSFIHRFKPADILEHELVHEMSAARWRMRRIEAMESALFDKAIEDQLANPDNDPARAQMLAYIEVAESKSYRGLQRHQAQLRRSYEKAWKELELIQAARGQADEIDEVQNEPTDGLTMEMLEILTAPTAMPHSNTPPVTMSPGAQQHARLAL